MLLSAILTPFPPPSQPSAASTTPAKIETTLVVEGEESKSPELVFEETAPVKKIGSDEAVTPPRRVSADKKTKTKKKSGSVAEEGGEKRNGMFGLFLAATMVCAGVGAAGVAGDFESEVRAVVKGATEMCAWHDFWGGREREQESLAGAVCALGKEGEQAFELSQDQ